MNSRASSPTEPFAHLFAVKPSERPLSVPALSMASSSTDTEEHIVAAASANGSSGATVPPEEAVLLGLLRAEEPILAELAQIKHELAQRLLGSMKGDVRQSLVLAKILREIAVTAGVIGRRQQSAALAVASLRAQRRLLEVRNGN